MFFEYGFPQDRREIAPDSPERFHERAVVGLVEGHWLDACNQPINQKLMMDSSNRPVPANHILLCEPSPVDNINSCLPRAGTAFERGLESQPEHEALRSIAENGWKVVYKVMRARFGVKGFEVVYAFDDNHPFGLDLPVGHRPCTRLSGQPPRRKKVKTSASGGTSEVGIADLTLSQSHNVSNGATPPAPRAQNHSYSTLTPASGSNIIRQYSQSTHPSSTNPPSSRLVSPTRPKQSQWHSAQSLLTWWLAHNKLSTAHLSAAQNSITEFLSSLSPALTPYGTHFKWLGVQSPVDLLGLIDSGGEEELEVFLDEIDVLVGSVLGVKGPRMKM
ncbi:uncharacterized protein PGTG_16537 [Puccinia graminis f. sp. tritici CRL 75-36-700-3]|uniref:Uncharacterized protein n=1 Tax=Puccinia graminis f. sp. tritici (strain CRL 75-36-700-3 / race SCCL) TaxID=418459 RepID=E3L134_PUCGT|nr:uncharacterized protein PGTG_16537 [Puccinia graminis f. sp. tritici CRL 75-36-700-3]EFP90259.2 hypothetical protein PGTG_16537 [Puccinia graminis f. sp. tritici CRL 75-36-700-3]